MVVFIPAVPQLKILQLVHSQVAIHLGHPAFHPPYPPLEVLVHGHHIHQVFYQVMAPVFLQHRIPLVDLLVILVHGHQKGQVSILPKAPANFLLPSQVMLPVLNRVNFLLIGPLCNQLHCLLAVLPIDQADHPRSLPVGLLQEIRVPPPVVVFIPAVPQLSILQ